MRPRVCLGAVEPNRLRSIRNSQRILLKRSGSIRSNSDEARVEPALNRCTGVRESGLSDRVGTGRTSEDEGDFVTGCCCDVVGGELESGDCHDVLSLRGDSRGEDERGDDSSTHDDREFWLVGWVSG